jgi:hypothetical protein
MNFFAFEELSQLFSMVCPAFVSFEFASVEFKAGKIPLSGNHPASISTPRSFER